MGWLSQNWVWIGLAVGAFFLMSRMGGCGMGRAGGHRRGLQESDDRRPETRMDTGTTFDPVSRHAVTAGMAAASSVYRGRAFYFENRDNRDRFERDPEKYLEGAENPGQPVEREHEYAGDEYAGERRHRHGCC